MYFLYFYAIGTNWNFTALGKTSLSYIYCRDCFEPFHCTVWIPYVAVCRSVLPCNVLSLYTCCSL